MGGGEISSSEHLGVLLQAYQYAEKIHTQCVTDVVNAEIRRDEAEDAKKIAFDRLEQARERFASSSRRKSLTNGTTATELRSRDEATQSTVPSLKPNRFHSPKKSFGVPKEVGPGTSVHSMLSTNTHATQASHATQATADTGKGTAKTRSGSPKGTRASLKQSLKKAAQKQPQKKPSSAKSMDSTTMSFANQSVADENKRRDKSISPKRLSQGYRRPSEIKLTSPTPSVTSVTKDKQSGSDKSKQPQSSPSPQQQQQKKPVNMFKKMAQANMTSPKPADPNLPPAFRKSSVDETQLPKPPLEIKSPAKAAKEGLAERLNGGASKSGKNGGKAASPSKAPAKNTDASTVASAPSGTYAKPKSNSSLVSSNTQVPSLFSPTPTGPGSKRSLKQVLTRRSSMGYEKLNPATKVFDISKGRTAEWMQNNLDCERLGLVKNFFHASFGTRTSDKTQKVRVFTLVINDENHDIVTTCGELLDFYISINTGSSSNNNSSGAGSKPSLRDRAAEALVTPPQKEPIAIFALPKNAMQTSDIYYIGHWKVSDGKKLIPPKQIKGQARQTHVKFQFIGVDSALVRAMNGPSDKNTSIAEEEESKS